MINENFIILISFVCFVTISFKLLKKNVITMINSHIQETQDALEDAATLRLEAERYLLEAKEQLQNTKKTASDILLNAEKKAAFIASSMQRDLEAIAKKKQDVMLARLKQQEDAILKEAKYISVTNAIDSIEAYFNDEMDEESNHNMMKTLFNKSKHLIN